MAENELLDVSNPFIYRRWRTLLAAGDARPAEAADIFYEDFSVGLHRALRQEPLSKVFAACGQDRVALQAAVLTCKDRQLAKQVEQACKIAKSKDPHCVAAALADLIIQTLVDQCNYRSLSVLGYLNLDGQREIEAATLKRLEDARPHIKACLIASLEGNLSEVPKPARIRRPSAQELLKTSLALVPRRSREITSHD
jgi:hypothetical protein